MKRRSFITRSLAGGVAAGSALSLLHPQSVLAKRPRKTFSIQETGRYDLLLKGGHVIDPANNINSKMDVAITDGNIAGISANIPQNESKKTIDVSELYVTPGFIDMHAHGFYTDLTTSYQWVRFSDICFPSGVTTVLDVGSSGAETFEQFKKLIDMSKVRTLALLNISATGMNDKGEQDPAQYKIPSMVEMAQTYPDIIIGFKTAHYWTTPPYDKIHTPWASVDAVIEAGRRAGLPVMFDFFPRKPSDGYPARSYRELILEKGRPGDIHTHVFARHFPIIDENGKVNQDLFKAQERGFIFDVGHGAGSFVYRNAVPAIQQGFRPNTISTDLHGDNTCGPVVNMANVISKFLCMGLPIEDVILRSTINPARIMNRPELGQLTVGHTADVAVFEVLKGDFSYVDTSGGKNFGDQKIYNILTLSGGKIGFDPYGLSYPYWENAPKDSAYWVNPSGQYF
ncbi:MAG: amidohydrolase/deacetylase family metallohydrolase [Candidatus Latescibacteria bacterium]|nr:amidohydrolase/deacetylase family metallohydrolase [Candidatus Latescibacterota bacterium]